ncbi:MAG: UbiX family flavin prenyltransferase [Bacteroidales bacterium]|nr:UbiX family flavin prenyltransferase [Bacteroidales bacterium]
MGKSKRNIIIAVTGASGAIYAEKLFYRLKSLTNPPDEIAVVFSENATDIRRYELGAGNEGQGEEEFSLGEPFKYYDNRDFYAPFASGSAKYDTMIVCPASMGMIGRIAYGVSDDLITRAADVILKERRKLILVPRETPYSLIHINNMKLLTEAGAVICPASPSFYCKPKTIDELVLTVVDRVLDLAGFDVDGYQWGEGRGARGMGKEDGGRKTK